MKQVNNIEAKWDKRFIDMTNLVATWSTCYRRQVGAVIVKEHRVLAVGYAGAPAGVKNCFERGECLRDKLGIESGKQRELCYSLCAEQNAIVQAARMGFNTKDSTLYCSLTPCTACAKQIINAGITRIVCVDKYPDDFSLGLLKEAGIIVEFFNDKTKVKK